MIVIIIIIIVVVIGMLAQEYFRGIPVVTDSVDVNFDIISFMFENVNSFTQFVSKQFVKLNNF